MKKFNFSRSYFNYVSEISKKIDQKKLEIFVDKLLFTKKNKGRVFFLGVGGSAGNCSHAVNDFRKLCNLESYTVVDNISELTAGDELQTLTDSQIKVIHGWINSNYKLKLSWKLRLKRLVKSIVYFQNK